MNICIIPGQYCFENHGESAMVRIACRRIRQQWPEARIQVITSDATGLARLCPGAEPLCVSGHYEFFCPGTFLGRSYVLAPELERRARVTFPRAAAASIELKKKLRGRQLNGLSVFVREILDCDVFILSGCGSFHDAFKKDALDKLDLMDMALRSGKPVLAMGQGIGTIYDREIVRSLRRVAPAMKCWAVREGVHTPSVLTRCGVSASRIVRTGDDAVELAYGLRPRSLGDKIGVNIRVAPYAHVDIELSSAISLLLLSNARNLGTKVLPLPISFNDDMKSLQEMYRLDPSTFTQRPTYPEIEELVRAAGCCRIVVTGSYHVGVFSLSQGVPVIALVNNEYYQRKFEGLRAQFEGGCTIVQLDGPDAEEAISRAMRLAYESSEAMRTSLLRAAAEQIEAGRHAYAQLPNLIAVKQACRFARSRRWRKGKNKTTGRMQIATQRI